MPSATQITEIRRKMKQTSSGKSNKRARAKAGTPKFPIDPAKAGPTSAEKKKA